MSWTIRCKSSSLGMRRCIPRTYSSRHNYLSLGMPESSPYSSTNMRLSSSYSILPIHMICIVLTCIIVVFTCLGLSYLVLLGSFFGFYCFFTFTYKFKTTKKYFLFFCFFIWFFLCILYRFHFWFFYLDFSLL